MGTQCQGSSGFPCVPLVPKPQLPLVPKLQLLLVPKPQLPLVMLDANLSADDSKLEYVAGMPGGRELILSLVEKGRALPVPDIEDRFGLREMLSPQSRDLNFIASFLYYFGVLTLTGETEQLQLMLKVPNLVMQSLYVERIRRMMLPDPVIRDEGRLAAEKVYQEGGRVCSFVQNRLFTVFKNRDYAQANELTIKTAFLALLYNDILYIMDSEPELERRYADLTMIIRPDKRHGKIFDVLIEFKFLSLKELGLSGEAIRDMGSMNCVPCPCFPGHWKTARPRPWITATAWPESTGT